MNQSIHRLGMNHKVSFKRKHNFWMKKVWFKLTVNEVMEITYEEKTFLGGLGSQGSFRV